ncbi:MAG: membrane dipeptidase [Chloroflexota bacterium]|nr:membrane dipeptidase [Chloroflexota bacterium]
MSSDRLSVLAHLHMQRDFTAEGIEYREPAVDVPGRQVDIPKLKRGGVDCIWLSEGAPGEFTADPMPARHATVQPNTQMFRRTFFEGAPGVQRLLRGFDAVRRLCAGSTDLELVTTTEGIRSASAAGKIAVLLHTENLLMAKDLSMLRAYHELGLRVTGLVHAAPQSWIDCDSEQRLPGGLTCFGREVIQELNRLGILIDVSHASMSAIDHVLEESREPIVASHSNSKAISPIQRNLTDDHIRRISDGGGVVGIHCSSAFVDIKCQQGRGEGPGISASERERGLQLLDDVRSGRLDPFAAEAGARSGVAKPLYARFPTVGLDALVDTVDYMVNLAGYEHVGIGTDFEFLEDVIEGFSGAHETPQFLAALEARGYSRREVDAIAGENFMRVMAEVID